MIDVNKLIGKIKKDDIRNQVILVILALVCLLGLGALVSRCIGPAVAPVPPVAVSAPAVPVKAEVQAASAGTQGLKVTVRGIKSAEVKSPKQKPFGSAPSTPQAGSDFEIILEATQSLVMASSASVEVKSHSAPTAGQLEHAKLGVMVGLVPGYVAADFQLAKMDLPLWLFNTPMEVGLDVEANHMQMGLGLSAGEKAFATAGSYLTYGDWQQGYYLGLGLRF